jgi:hypothetical protein
MEPLSDSQFIKVENEENENIQHLNEKNFIVEKWNSLLFIQRQQLVTKLKSDETSEKKRRCVWCQREA